MMDISQYITEFKANRITRRTSARQRVVVTDKTQLIEEILKCIREDGLHCDLNHIDVSSIVDFSYLFSNYASFFDGDISDWDTSSATDFSYMFYRTNYTGNYGSISDWNVERVKNANKMFCNSRFDGDLSMWNMKSIKSASMFLANAPIGKTRKHWPKQFR